MHCAIKNVQFHSVSSIVKNGCVHATNKMRSRIDVTMGSISSKIFPTNPLNHKLMQHGSLFKPSCVSSIHHIVILSIDASFVRNYLVRLFYRSMLFNTTNSYINEQKQGQNSEVICTYIHMYDEGQKTQFLNLFFVFGRCFPLFMERK